MMTRRAILLLLPALAISFSVRADARRVGASEAGKIERKQLTSGGKRRTYYLYVPAGATASAPVPLLVTLHGSGMDGRGLVAEWKRLAQKESFVVAGPDARNSGGWIVPDDGPEFLRDLVEEIKSAAPVDPRRVYLFGWSAGANFGLQMSLYESEYFAASSIFAGALLPSRYPMLDAASRKIPISLTVGMSDPLYSLRDVRATRDALKTHDFPVQLRELLGRDHDYYADADEINRIAWAFVSQYRLDAEPRFRDLNMARTPKDSTPKEQR
jgi:poly(3-hydroxybutyrate) depolymerase